MLFGECTDIYLGNFVGKCIVSPDYGEKTQFPLILLEKKIKYVT